MNRKRIIVAATFIMTIACLLSAKLQYTYAAEKDGTIIKGVFIDQVEISGMTETQAQAAVNSYMQGLRDKKIAITVGNDMVYTTMGEIGFTYQPHRYIKQALGLATQGNLVKKYKDLKDIEQGRIIYPLTFTFDEAKLKNLVDTKVAIHGIIPVNATLTRENGEFIYTNHTVGSKVDPKQTLEQIKAAISDWNRLDIVVNAVMVDDMPEYTLEDVQRCNTVLGSFTTDFKDSAEGRASNLANGANLINKAVLFPGEIFSAYDYLVPFTEGNGYYVAHAYSEGRIVDSIGGGACQVTTTLYNAVLFSELEIVERSSHSMTVSYVPLSMDAAIAEGSKNFQFKNNTDAPILIEAYSEDRKITFKIWGHEVRDTAKRRLEFVSNTVTEIPPPSKEIVTKDSTQPTTYRKVTQKARYGYKAELYKVVYEDDVEVEKVLINKSYYGAEPNHVTIGTKKVSNKDKDKKTKDKKDKSGN